MADNEYIKSPIVGMERHANGLVCVTLRGKSMSLGTAPIVGSTREPNMTSEFPLLLHALSHRAKAVPQNGFDYVLDFVFSE